MVQDGLDAVEFRCAAVLPLCSARLTAYGRLGKAKFDSPGRKKRPWTPEPDAQTLAVVSAALARGARAEPPSRRHNTPLP